jgi:hypothetical protein
MLLSIDTLLRQQDLAVAAAILQLVIIPLAAGTTAAILALRKRLGRIGVQRVLSSDAAGNPMWKLAVGCFAGPVRRCTVWVNDTKLNWDRAGTQQLDIEAGGMGIASVRFQVDPRATVTVRSGSFRVFRSRFGELEDYDKKSHNRLE